MANSFLGVVLRLFLVAACVVGFLHAGAVECPVEAMIEAETDRSTGEPIVGAVGNRSLVCPCSTRNCLPMCCRKAANSTVKECLPEEITSASGFPSIHDPETLEYIPGGLQLDDFHVFFWDPCPGSEKYRLVPDEDPADEYKFLANGSIYLITQDQMVNFTDYCVDSSDDVAYKIILCFDDDPGPEIPKEVIGVATPYGMILSVPFLLVTFIVYSVIPELRNMHGATLRGYVGPLIIAYIFLAFLQTHRDHEINLSVCILIAFVIHFSFLASFFWLNVMCFDIWWTFGGFRSLQGSVKQRERKKFIIYSIYAWGSATLLTGVCLIMDFVPSVPRNFIRPEFGVESCWFSTNIARAIYFYCPMGVTVICNICLFVSTALKIIQHKKDTAHHLKGMDSRRHDDNKQWFNLYLKLFIVMGINWSMEIVSWLFENTPQYVWYITDLANTLQGLIIFIIFVWKDKIKRLLLKRIGRQSTSFQSRNSTRSAYHSSASRTCTTTAVMAPLHEKSNPYVERPKPTTDESDCV